VLFLTSRLLSQAGVLHGFSCRAGGVSSGPFASLNLSVSVGDSEEAVRENTSRLARAAGIEGGFATAHQVHGDRVVAASAGPQKKNSHFFFRELVPPSEPCSEGADAVLALEPETAVGVRVADCVPVLLFDEASGAVAAVHSGWRGARLSISGRGVRALQHAAGADPARLLTAIGPCIGRCCYEVSPELASMFRAMFGPDAADDPALSQRPHLDLRLCVERALVAAGVPLGRIEQVPGCTSCDIDSFFSHRRDKGRTGRHLAFIAAQ